MIFPLILIGLKRIFDMHISLLKLQQHVKNKDFQLLSLDEIRAESSRHDAEQRRLEIIEKQLNVIPNRFKEKTFEDFQLDYSEQARCKKIAQNFVKTFKARLEEGTCLKFLGLSGTGKTLLSFIIYQELAKNGFSVKYEASLQFLRQFQEREFESFSAYQAILSTYQKTQLLIIDEVSVGNGKSGYPSDWQKTHLYTLINQRYLNRLSTIVISNHTNEELIERIGEPTVGRLTENGITLGFNWKSYRNH